MTDSEKKKKEKNSSEEKKKEKSSSGNQWGEAKYGKSDEEDKDHKTFGLMGMYKFTWPRVWRGGCFPKFIVIMNFLVIIFLKITAVFIPLLLKEVIDAITCDSSKFTQEAFKSDTTDKFLIRVGEKCPSSQETYALIGIYAAVKFLNNIIDGVR